MKQLAPFDEFKAKAEKLRITAETLTVTDINDKAGMKLARATRLELREVRIAIEKRRKELGEHHLRETQRINGDAKVLKELIEPLEARLQDQEDFIEREAARIASEKRNARTAELAPFLSGPVSVDLGTMTDEAYAGLLSDSKGLHEAKIAREKKEREEAEAAVKAERERIEAQRLENERLKKEAVEREAAAEKQRQAAAAALKAEQDRAAERERVIQARAIEAQRIADENARAQAAKADAERKAREQAEKQIAAVRAEKLALAKAAADAEEAAAAAPEKEKLRALAKTIRELHVPVLTTEKGVAAVVEIAAKVEAFAAWIGKKAEAL